MCSVPRSHSFTHTSAIPRPLLCTWQCARGWGGSLKGENTKLLPWRSSVYRETRYAHINIRQCDINLTSICWVPMLYQAWMMLYQKQQGDTRNQHGLVEDATPGVGSEDWGQFNWAASPFLAEGTLIRMSIHCFEYFKFFNRNSPFRNSVLRDIVSCFWPSELCGA
jgi:hypothetical protein